MQNKLIYNDKLFYTVTIIASQIRLEKKKIGNAMRQESKYKREVVGGEKNYNSHTPQGR